MKITPTVAGSRPASTSSGTQRAAKASVVSSSAAPATADEVTQAGLQAAQQSLNDARSEVDYDKVAQMQAALSAGTLSVDPDQLAGDMLNFFRQ
ncbi:flagellar biosynthesis anti-sigma factor FlgM [Phytobacter massiliensis]|uniref:flagellar biosynthesis anti-sigma factor FlgM n=1 Tax=Phytobacter massiliensis TaxID=1485952 RepID=UPI000317AD0F|nr:flagellar biosynthesis anti-sigma factor FlgM [Phytobacter massiliensis]